MEIEGHFLTWEQAEKSYRNMLAHKAERDVIARIETPELFTKTPLPESVVRLHERRAAALLR